MTRGNRLRIEQVIINLMRNAITAMRDVEERHLLITVRSSGMSAELAIADTGHGLDGASIDELREPFHSTQPSGEGMGLGLAISSAIVREHEGELIAGARDGGGAVFTIRLPLCLEEPLH